MAFCAITLPESAEPDPVATPPQQPRRGPRATDTDTWTERLLGIASLGIAILWVAGIARFRDHELKPVEWLMLIAGGFALQIITKRAWAHRPMPPLPEGARAMHLATLIAAIIAAMACVFGGILELVAQAYLPSEVPWGLRMLWHAACAFGASYCMFLQRLLGVLPA